MNLRTAALTLVISTYGFAVNAVATGSYDTQDSASLRQVDRSKTRKTAEQQGLSNADTETTRQVRQALMKDPTLSVEAKNVTIITVDGRVTLKGAMSSSEEIHSVVDKARGVAGAAAVSNQINLK